MQRGGMSLDIYSFCKACIAFTDASLSYVLVITWISGWALHRDETRSISDIQQHKLKSRLILYLTAAVILEVEVFKFFFPRHHARSMFFWIHLFGFALPFFLLLWIISLWVTGKRFPRFHRWLVHPCVLTGLGTCFLGMVLLVQYS